MFVSPYATIATSFTEGHVNETAFRNLLQFQINNRLNGIVLTNTTGEAAILDFFCEITDSNQGKL